MSYSFTILLKDLASSPLSKIASGVENLQSKVHSFSSKTLSETSKAGKGFENLSSKVNKADTEITNLGKASTTTGSKLSSLTGIAVKFFAAFATFQTVKALFNVGVEAEQANVKFEVLLGSISKANAMLKDLTEYANNTPYSFKGLQKGAETMLGFGIAEEKILPAMKMLGDVAMGSDEKLSGLSLVYSQIMATGKLMGQDLLQLINQGFNPLQIISEQTGLSMGALKEKMEKGAISSDMVSEAFRIATSEGGRYYQMSEKMSQTAGGKWSTMMDAFAEVTKKVGLQFATWISPLFDIGIAFSDKIIPFGRWLMGFLPSLETFKTIMQALGIVALAVGSYLLFVNASTIAWSITLGILEGIIWLVQTAQWAWNIAMSLNPIGLIIAAVVALVGVVVLLWNKFSWFRGAVLGVWEVLKGFGTMIKNYVINRIKELLNGIMGIGKALLAFFKGDFSEAWNIGKKAVGNLVGVESKAQALKDGKEAFKSFNKGWEKGKEATAPKTVQNIQKANKTVPVVATQKSTLFNALLGNNTNNGKGKKGKVKAPKSAKEKSEGIISGGAKQTNITINIQKLNDKIEVITNNLREGASEIEDKMQEILLRALNSVNQMQT